MFNKKSLHANSISGSYLYIPNLSPPEHVMVGLYYVKKAFEKMKELLNTGELDLFDCHLLRPLDELPPSQETITTFSSQQCATDNMITEMPIGPNKLTKIMNLKHGMNVNVIGKCTFKSDLAYGGRWQTKYFIISLTQGGHTIKVTLSSRLTRLRNYIKLNYWYMINGEVKEEWCNRGGKRCRELNIRLNETEAIKRISEQIDEVG